MHLTWLSWVPTEVLNHTHTHKHTYTHSSERIAEMWKMSRNLPRLDPAGKEFGGQPHHAFRRCWNNEMVANHQGLPPRLQISQGESWRPQGLSVSPQGHLAHVWPHCDLSPDQLTHSQELVPLLPAAFSLALNEHAMCLCLHRGL